ncbi:hypothetical protein NIES2134_107130 [Thermostichus vulcanus NIES-2134]|nr:hypothetical protein NIES2134_107130 [Thermostichus vulcanus NIES-2134]
MAPAETLCTASASVRKSPLPSGATTRPAGAVWKSDHCTTRGTSRVSLAVTSRSGVHTTPDLRGFTTTWMRVVPAPNCWGLTCTWLLSTRICPGPPVTSNSAVALWPGASIPRSNLATLALRRWLWDEGGAVSVARPATVSTASNTAASPRPRSIKASTVAWRLSSEGSWCSCVSNCPQRWSSARAAGSCCRSTPRRRVCNCWLLRGEPRATSRARLPSNGVSWFKVALERGEVMVNATLALLLSGGSRGGFWAASGLPAAWPG